MRQEESMANTSPNEDQRVDPSLFIGKMAKFNYPEGCLPEYAARRGQLVRILRLTPEEEFFQIPDDPLFDIQADDGWIGNAWASELELVEPDLSATDANAC